jgi:hypothetical protein
MDNVITDTLSRRMKGVEGEELWAILAFIVVWVDELQVEP